MFYIAREKETCSNTVPINKKWHYLQLVPFRDVSIFYIKSINVPLYNFPCVTIVTTNSKYEYAKKKKIYKNTDTVDMFHCARYIFFMLKEMR